MLEAFGPFQDPTNWVAISFAIFAVVFWRKGLGPLLAKLDTHINEVRDELTKAEQLKQDAADLLAEYKEKHANALDKAADIVAETRSQAARQNAKLEADFKETLARRETQLAERLARMEQAAADEMRQLVAAVAVDTARQALAEGAVDKTAQAKLVEASVSAISKAA